jgi:hypothetical protein
MRRASLLALALAAGCEFFAFADRSEIPGGGGGGTTTGTGGAPATTSASSASTTGGGTGGGLECVKPIDCPGADTDCTRRTCEEGRCGTGFVAQGTPTSMQIARDCQRSVCDGAGDPHLVADDLDVPVDGNPCTDDVCTAGSPSNPPSAAGKPCVGGVCDGAGNCPG